MDSKPLLQERPPAYNAVPGAYEYGPQHNYGAIAPPAQPQPGFQQPPPPYQYPEGPGKRHLAAVNPFNFAPFAFDGGFYI